MKSSSKNWQYRARVRELCGSCVTDHPICRCQFVRRILTPSSPDGTYQLPAVVPKEDHRYVHLLQEPSPSTCTPSKPGNERSRMGCQSVQARHRSQSRETPCCKSMGLDLKIRSLCGSSFLLFQALSPDHRRFVSVNSTIEKQYGIAKSEPSTGWPV